MLKSMTGFGKEVVETSGRKITIEIRTLNSKQLDLNLRLPADFREKEPEIRTFLSKKLQRGKVDVTFMQESITADLAPEINKSLAIHYFQEMAEVARSVGESNFSGFLPVIMKMPDILVQTKKETDPEEWKTIFRGLENAVAKVDEFRIHEGEILKKDFIKRINIILDLLSQIEPYEQERVPAVKERIKKRLEEWAGDAGTDANRLEQEMIFYIEKFDITEEKVRLKKHCDYFLETLNSSESPGKKLGFVTQEIGREINTIGSKANHAAIQKLVVLMKDELEKIKEQLFNIL
jgi:uncharacterized protein (TIGR00255 family)